MSRWLYAVAVLAACSGSTEPLGLTLKDANGLANSLDPIDHAVATPQLRSLSGLALPILQAGIDAHNISSTELGKTIEWSSVLGRIVFGTRPGAPADAMRVILYTTDSTFRPAFPLVEVGYADLYPHNIYNGGGPDSMSLRFVLADTHGTVVADFLAHSHADTTCVQCATVTGWADDGTTRVDFNVPYNIPLNGDGRFPGTFTVGTLGFQHFATLPGPGVNTATANITVAFGGDSITATSGLLHLHAGRLDGQSTVTIGGESYATVTRSATGVSGTGPNGRALTSTELRALGALFAVPADIAEYIEWPTFVVFFCGC